MRGVCLERARRLFSLASPHHVFVLLACALFSCGSAPKECANVPDVSDCSGQTLSYDTGISDVLNRRCQPCHASGGVEAAVLLTDYGHVSGERMSIASQLVACDMPPDGSPQLTDDERKQILDWLSCGGPR